MKKKWYFDDCFIGVMFALWPIYGIPLIIGCVLIILKKRTLNNETLFVSDEISQLKNSINNLTNENDNLKTKLTEIGADSYSEVQMKITAATQEVSQYDYTVEKLKSEIEQLKLESERLSVENGKIEHSILTNKNKVSKIRELYTGVKYTIDNFFVTDAFSEDYRDFTQLESDLDEYCPSVILKLHCMDLKELKKAYRDNDKKIDEILEMFASRYTTKGNKAIYRLMVIALRAELQNILANLKYEKLNTSIDLVKDVSRKYLEIASTGNQSIAGTLNKFIGEIEYLFINAVKIEYNYYVKKEQAKQEQLALKEQMKQEAEERKALLAEKQKIEQEESKYNTEIGKLQEMLSNANDTEIEKLNARILALQAQLSDVTIKKAEISKLANGKAGNVYIISNLGSFGDNVFKVGMTRRMNPQDRVNELGDASVPFRFDVHSFIFSDDAVGLESKLHNILNDKRVNKVNLRKEFFYCSIDELEQLVTEIEPTAEFNKTMLAEEFRQSQSSDEIYTSDFVSDEDIDEE